LPQGADHWPLERQRAVLAHELTHVRRQDYLAQILAHVAAALYWFHPLMWLAAGQFRKERERACDDGVMLGLGMKGSDYAEHLLAVARSIKGKHRLWPVAVGMAQHFGLESRVAAVVDPKRKRRILTEKAAIFTAAASMALMLPLAVMRATAQSSPAGRISGMIYDGSGATVPGAIVTAYNPDTGKQETTISGDAGDYLLAAIPVGRYVVQVRKPGFRLFQNEGVVLDANAPLRLDVKVEVGEITESVEVTGKAPPAAKISNAAPRRIRVGGNVQASRLIYQAPPIYPRRAEEQGIQGAVVLRAVIGKDGGLMSLSAINTADRDLTEAALEAVKQWRYEPTLLNGQPIEVVTTITLNFRLKP